MSPGVLDAALIHRHLSALDAAVQQLRRHAGRPVTALADLDESWTVAAAAAARRAIRRGRPRAR